MSATENPNVTRWGAPRTEIAASERLNPLASKVLIWTARSRLRKLNRIVGIMLSSDLRCREFGPGLQIGHPYGIVVHDDAVLGRDCRIGPNVTIGMHNGKWGLPIIGDDVMIGAGAVILGPVRVGDGAFIGANAVVVDDVSPNAVVAGVPGRTVGYRKSSADGAGLTASDEA